MNFLNNPWIIGIGSGVVSGVFVYFLTSFLFDKKRNKEYLQKVAIANNDLLYIMRPLVVQKNIPSEKIVVSIIHSIARKHKVDIKDILSIDSLAEELSREVMENSFLDSESKIIFCNKIAELSKSSSIKKNFDSSDKKDEPTYSKMSSIVLSGTVTVLVAMTTFSSEVSRNSNDFSEPLIIITIGAVVPTLLLFVMTILIKDRLKKNKDKNNRDN